MGTKIKKSVVMVSHLVSADFLSKFIGIAVLAFYARYLSKDDLAVLPVYDMVGAMGAVVFSFGIFPTFVRTLPSLLSSDRAKARAIMVTGIAVIVPGLVCYSVVVAGLAEFISNAFFKEGRYAALIRIMAVGFFAVGVRTITDYLLWSSGRFSRMATVKVVQSLMNALVAAGLLLIWGLKGLVIGLVLRDVTAAALSVFFLGDILFTGPLIIDSPRKLIRESLPYYLESYVLYFKERGDTLIVATFLGPSLLAVYYIARRLYDALLTVFNSVDRVITAGLSGKRQSPAEVEAHLEKVLTAVSQLLLPFVMFCLGMVPLFIRLVAGPRYVAAIIPGAILCLALAVQFTWSPVGRAIFVLRPPMTRFKLSLVEATSLIVWLSALVPLLQVVGVAAARLLAALTIGVTAYVVAGRFVRVNGLGKAFLASAGASVLMGSVMLVGQVLQPKMELAPVFVFGGIVVFLIFTSIFNSGPFYSTLNAILPLKIVDPIRATVFGGRAHSD